MKPVVKIAGESDAVGISEGLMDGRVEYTQTRRINIPAEALKKSRIITGLENDTTTTAYKMLRTQVLQRLKAQGWTTLAVTSPGPGEGKTLTAINLAVCLAREVNHTVLLVDADMRRPAVARYFGFAPQFGLYDYVASGIELHRILFNPGIDRLVVLPGVNSVTNSSELLSSPKMVRLAEELKTRYPERLVLFDMPPLLAADDLLAFAPNVDAALLVINEGKTRKDELKRSMELLEGINIAGTVLNKVKQAIPAYGY